MRADRHPPGSASPAPSRRRPGALTSEPRPRRVRGRAREGGRARAGVGGSVRAPVPAGPAQPGIPGGEGGWVRSLSRPRAAALRCGRGLSPGPPRAGVRSGGRAARRPDPGRAAAASPPPAAAAAATRGSATSAPPRPTLPPPRAGREPRKTWPRVTAARNGGQSRVGGRARWGWGRGWGTQEEAPCFCSGGDPNCGPSDFLPLSTLARLASPGSVPRQTRGHDGAASGTPSSSVVYMAPFM